MLRETTIPNKYIVSWDYKSSPNWDQISRAIKMVSCFTIRVCLIDIDTHCDDHAVLISDTEDTTESARKIYLDAIEL